MATFIRYLFTLLIIGFILESCDESEPVIEICDNGLDDDGDGVIDCADADCYALAACFVNGREICDDGIDDDGDNVTDCDDADCNSYSSCRTGQVIEICNNGVDDDGDGLIDCDDADCNSFHECVSTDTLEICNNGIDDDLDGFTDCLDRDCLSFMACNGCPSRPLPLGGPWHVGYLMIAEYPQVNFADSFIFLTNPNEEFVFMHHTGDQVLESSVFNDMTHQYDMPGFTFDHWPVGEEDSLFDVTVTKGNLRMTTCFSFVMNFDSVRIGGSTLPALQGETFPIENVSFVTSEEFWQQ